MSIEREVIKLVAERQGIRLEKITPQSTFYRLGIDGDDAVELIVLLCEKYDIDQDQIDLGRYTIGPEGWA